MNLQISPVLTFYFDPISPFAWLASKEIKRLEATGLMIDTQPILFAAVLNAHGNIGPAEIPAKRDYIFRDVMRLAAQRGYAMQGPPTHPYNPLKALRMCSALEDREERKHFAQALMNAAWEDGRDLTDPAVLEDIAKQCDLQAKTLLLQMETPMIKQRLIEATARAVDVGVFGVPTFVLNGELFWGCDRIDSLLWRHAGNQIDEAGLQRCLQREASANRR